MNRVDWPTEPGWWWEIDTKKRCAINGPQAKQWTADMIVYHCYGAARYDGIEFVGPIEMPDKVVRDRSIIEFVGEFNGMHRPPRYSSLPGKYCVYKFGTYQEVPVGMFPSKFKITLSELETYGVLREDE